jgi:hypothetical protein
MMILWTNDPLIKREMDHWNPIWRLTCASIRRRVRAQAAARRTEGVVDRLLADRQADLELENGDPSPWSGPEPGPLCP